MTIAEFSVQEGLMGIFVAILVIGNAAMFGLLVYTIGQFFQSIVKPLRPKCRRDHRLERWNDIFKTASVKLPKRLTDAEEEKINTALCRMIEDSIKKHLKKNDN